MRVPSCVVEVEVRKRRATWLVRKRWRWLQHTIGGLIGFSNALIQVPLTPTSTRNIRKLVPHGQETSRIQSDHQIRDVTSPGRSESAWL